MIRFAEKKSSGFNNEVLTVRECHLFCEKYIKGKLYSTCEHLMDLRDFKNGVVKIICSRPKQ